MSTNFVIVSGNYLTVQFDLDKNMAQILEMDERLRCEKYTMDPKFFGIFNDIKFISCNYPAVYGLILKSKQTEFYLRGNSKINDNEWFSVNVGVYTLIQAIAEFNTNYKFEPTSEEVTKKVNEFLRKENLPYQIDESSIVLSRK